LGVSDPHLEVRLPLWRVPATDFLGTETFVDYQPGARHTMVGGEYHCCHDHGETATFRIIYARRPEQLTTAMQLMDARTALIVSNCSRLQ